MPRPRTNRKTARLTVTLDEDAYALLNELAQREDVSVAWLVRRAVNNLINGKRPANDAPVPLARKQGRRR